ncbi:MAG: hypothetical protein RI894_37 [Bacteroidota bacterium]
MELEKSPSLCTGKSYARCWIAPEYENFPDSNFTVSPQVAKAIPQKRFRVIEPVIGEKIDSVISRKDEQGEWLLNTKQKLPKQVKIIPPVYTLKQGSKEVTPAAVRLVYRRGDANGLSQNPDDCAVFAFIELLPQYDRITTRIELKPPRKIIGQDTIRLDNAELKRFGTFYKRVEKITYYHESPYNSSKMASTNVFLALSCK